jgi:hypothetical protein
MLPVLLYQSKTWSVTLGEEQELRISENRMLKGTVWSKRGARNRIMEKLHNKIIFVYFFFPNII